MPLTLSEKKLYLLDIAWLISMAHQSPVKTPGTKAEAILQSSDSRSGVEPSRVSTRRCEGSGSSEPHPRQPCPNLGCEVPSQALNELCNRHGLNVGDTVGSRSHLARPSAVSLLEDARYVTWFLGHPNQCARPL